MPEQFVNEPNEEHLSLMRAADELGKAVAMGRESESMRARIARIYSHEEIASFLLIEWRPVEKKRRWCNRVLGEVRRVYKWALYLGAIAWYAATFRGVHLPPHFWAYWGAGIAVAIVIFAAVLVPVQNRSLGFATLLLWYGDIRHIGFFIEELNFLKKPEHAKVRLSKLLVQFHSADRPTLTREQQTILARELSCGIRKVTRPERFSDVDVRFLAALLVYYQQGSQVGIPIPAEAQAAWKRLAISPSVSPIGQEGQWQRVREAIKACMSNGAEDRTLTRSELNNG